MNIDQSDRPAAPHATPGRASRWERAAMAGVVIAIFGGMIWLSHHEKPAPKVAPQEQPDEARTLLVGSEARSIFVSKALYDLAKGPLDLASLQSHDAIKACLREHGLEKAWYVVTYTGLESNGVSGPMTQHGRPFDDSSKAWELRAVLATIQGNPPRNQTTDFSKATIRRIPDELANADPREAIDELLERSESAEVLSAP